jgi:diguanylate cyclase (GGDEF)-like protein
VTLRARLAIAFTAILVAPIGVGVAALAGLDRSPHSAPGPIGSAPMPGLEFSRRSIQSTVLAHCESLSAAARNLAVRAAVTGQPWIVTPADATGPWAMCGVEPDEAAPVVSLPTGLAARAEIRGHGGALVGYAYAVQALDDAFMAELSAAAGTRVQPALGGDLGPYQDQPLPLERGGPLAPAAGPVAPGDDSRGLAALVGGVALLAAGLLGWWAAGLATRPLRRLVVTADRVAAGDLDARAYVAGADEAGRLGRRLDEMIIRMQEMQRLSITDPLTGMGNVRHLAERLRIEIERANRFGRALGVLALDLDHFKDVNDRYGHGAGDAVLVELAARLRRAVREVDLTFRRGGEEFVILLPETDIAGSLTAAGRIGTSVRETPFPVRRLATPQVTITVSLGVAVFPRHARTGVDLLEAADQALYAAKEAGRDTFVLAGGPVPAEWTPDSSPSVGQ